jgi:MFS superfamily sulfate permease-like transporter
LLSRVPSNAPIAAEPPGSSASRFVTLFGSIRPYERAWLSRDVVAGVTLAALAIPEVMGYTKIVGTPVITGLYTMLLPVVAFALFASSRHLVVGGDSATAAILYAGIGALGIAGLQPYTARWTALASMAALLSALLLVLARLARLGFLADFISRTVLVGFLTGVGIQVALGQFAGMLGVAFLGSRARANTRSCRASQPVTAAPDQSALPCRLCRERSHRLGLNDQSALSKNAISSSIARR